MERSKLVKFPRKRDAMAYLLTLDAVRQDRDRLAVDDVEEFRGAFGFSGIFWSHRAPRAQAIALKQCLPLTDADFSRLAKAHALTVSPWGIHEVPGKFAAAYGYFVVSALLLLGLYSGAYAAASPAGPHSLWPGFITVLVTTLGAAAVTWWATVRPWRVYRAVVPPGALAASRRRISFSRRG